MKALKIVGIIVAVVLVGLMVAPMFYDVNAKVKPKIQAAIEENLNAKAEIGKLSLSALLGINVGIESLKIIETADNNVFFEMKDAKLKIPFLALLTGKLSVTLDAKNPTLRLNRDSQGVLNVSKLMKAKVQDSSAPTESGKPSAGAAGLSRIVFSTDIVDANIEFKDKQADFDYKIDKLNFKSNNVGLGRPFETQVSAELSVDNKKDILLKGKLVFDGETEIAMGSAGFENLNLNAKLDLTDLEVKYASLLNKAKGIPLTVVADIAATSNSLDMKNVELVANTFKVKTTGTVKDFSKPTMDVKVSSNELKLDEWKKIIGPLGEFDMDGTINFDVAVNGPLDKMQYAGNFDLKEASMKLPGVVPRATGLNADLQLKTNELDIKKVVMKIGSSDLNLSGELKDFEEPNVTLNYSSKKLNLDEMMPSEAKAEPQKGGGQPEDPKALEKSLAQLEGPIAMIRQNPFLRKMNLKAQTSIESLVIKGANVSNIKAVATFRNLVLAMDNATLNAFNGTGTADLKIDFSQKKPSYSFKAKVQKLDTNQAMVSQFKELDKTITGSANANFEVKGTGVTLDDLNKNLVGQGNMHVENGSWSGLSVLKIVGEKLKSIPKAGEVVSGIKVSDKFKTLKSDFTINGGRFNIQNGIMELEGANTSVTLNGFVTFSKDMQMKGDIVAPMGQVPKKMAANDGRGKVPYEVNGKVNDPKVDWDATLKPVAMAFAQQEGEKLIKKEVDKLKNDSVKKLFKGLKF